MSEDFLCVASDRPRLEGGGVFLITIRSWLVRRGETKGGKENMRRRRKYLGNRILLGRGRKISQSALIAYLPTDGSGGNLGGTSYQVVVEEPFAVLSLPPPFFLPPPSPRSVVFKNIFAHIVWKTAGSGGRRESA